MPEMLNCDRRLDVCSAQDWAIAARVRSPSLERLVLTALRQLRSRQAHSNQQSEVHWAYVYR